MIIRPLDTMFRWEPGLCAYGIDSGDEWTEWRIDTRNSTDLRIDRLVWCVNGYRASSPVGVEFHYSALMDMVAALGTPDETAA